MTDSEAVVLAGGMNSSGGEIEPLAPSDPNDPNKPAGFGFITENVYISPSLQNSKDRKRAKRMVCDCQFDPEGDPPEDACGENCLNRLLMIECGSRCPCGEYCNNKNFQRADYAKVEVFKTENKGWGLRALRPILEGSFVMEYCGEVCTLADFEQRKVEYSREKRRHYYFMSLKADQILDATRKGNLSRYINHSCDPNCETQKWTVNGRLCIGFFSVRRVEESEELTFDYQFQRFGDVAQKCFCGSANCRGYLGQAKQAPASIRVLSQPESAMVVVVSPQSPSTSATKRRGHSKQRLQTDADSAFEKEIYELVGSSWKLKSVDSRKNLDTVLAFSQTMLQAETFAQKMLLLRVLLTTTDVACLKKFLVFQGLKLLRLWMLDSMELEGHESLQFQIKVLQTLSHLPVGSKNQIKDVNLFPLVSRWATTTHTWSAKKRKRRKSRKGKSPSPGKGKSPPPGKGISPAPADVTSEPSTSEPTAVAGELAAQPALPTEEQSKKTGGEDAELCERTAEAMECAPSEGASGSTVREVESEIPTLGSPGEEGTQQPAIAPLEEDSGVSLATESAGVGSQADRCVVDGSALEQEPVDGDVVGGLVLPLTDTSVGGATSSSAGMGVAASSLAGAGVAADSSVTAHPAHEASAVPPAELPEDELPEDAESVPTMRTGCTIVGDPPLKSEVMEKQVVEKQAVDPLLKSEAVEKQAVDSMLKSEPEEKHTVEGKLLGECVKKEGKEGGSAIKSEGGGVAKMDVDIVKDEVVGVGMKKEGVDEKESVLLEKGSVAWDLCVGSIGKKEAGLHSPVGVVKNDVACWDPVKLETPADIQDVVKEQGLCGSSGVPLEGVVKGDESGTCDTSMDGPCLADATPVANTAPNEDSDALSATLDAYSTVEGTVGTSSTPGETIAASCVAVEASHSPGVSGDAGGVPMGASPSTVGVAGEASLIVDGSRNANNVAVDGGRDTDNVAVDGSRNTDNVAVDGSSNIDNVAVDATGTAVDTQSAMIVLSASNSSCPSQDTGVCDSDTSPPSVQDSDTQRAPIWDPDGGSGTSLMNASGNITSAEITGGNITSTEITGDHITSAETISDTNVAIGSGPDVNISDSADTADGQSSRMEVGMEQLGTGFKMGAVCGTGSEMEAVGGSGSRMASAGDSEPEAIGSCSEMETTSFEMEATGSNMEATAGSEIDASSRGGTSVMETTGEDALGISQSLMEAVGISQSMMDAISVSLTALRAGGVGAGVIGEAGGMGAGVIGEAEAGTSAVPGNAAGDVNHTPQGSASHTPEQAVGQDAVGSWSVESVRCVSSVGDSDTASHTPKDGGIVKEDGYCLSKEETADYVGCNDVAHGDRIHDNCIHGEEVVGRSLGDTPQDKSAGQTGEAAARSPGEMAEASPSNSSSPVEDTSTGPFRTLVQPEQSLTSCSPVELASTELASTDFTKGSLSASMSYSPKEVSSSPKEVSPSPKEVSPSPKEISPSPKEVGPSPKEVGPSPKEASPSPGEEMLTDESLKATGLTPEDDSPMEDLTSQSPKEGSNSPQEGSHSPRDGSHSSKDGSHSPKDGSHSSKDGSHSPEASHSDSGDEISSEAKKEFEEMQLVVKSLAEGLLEKWSSLKEVFRIPKRTRAAKQDTTSPDTPPEVGGGGEEPEEEPAPAAKRWKGRVMGKKENDHGSHFHQQHYRPHKGPSHALMQQQQSAVLPSSPHTPHGHHGSPYQATPSHGSSYQATPSHGSPYQAPPSHGQGSSPYPHAQGLSPYQTTPHHAQGSPYQATPSHVPGSAQYTGVTYNTVMVQQQQLKQPRLQSIPPLLPPSSSTNQGLQQVTPPSLLQVTPPSQQHPFRPSPHLHQPGANVTAPTLSVHAGTSPRVMAMPPNSAPSGMVPLPRSGLVTNQMAAATGLGGINPGQVAPNPQLVSNQIPGLTLMAANTGLTPSSHLQGHAHPQGHAQLQGHPHPQGPEGHAHPQRHALLQGNVTPMPAASAAYPTGPRMNSVPAPNLMSSAVRGVSRLAPNTGPGLLPDPTTPTAYGSPTAAVAQPTATVPQGQLQQLMVSPIRGSLPPSNRHTSSNSSVVAYAQQQQQQQQTQVTTPSPHPLTLQPLPPLEEAYLPPNWKTAHDPSGKVYYYHAITRKTQWNMPTGQDEITVTMDLGTPDHSSGEDEPELRDKSVGPHTPTEDEREAEFDGRDRQPHTPEGTPPHSPIDARPTTYSASPSASPGNLVIPASPKHHRHHRHHRHSKRHRRSRSSSQPYASNRSNSASLRSPTPHTPPMSPLDHTHSKRSGKRKSSSPASKKRKKESKSRAREIDEFRHTLSKTVTACLDQHRKSDCKYGRITCADDFKYLARKLTYGLTEKESGRKRKGKLEFTSSVKTRVKEYIRQYMKKIGPVYRKASSSPPQDIA